MVGWLLFSTREYKIRFWNTHAHAPKIRTSCTKAPTIGTIPPLPPGRRKYDGVDVYIHIFLKNMNQVQGI